ncbi:MAG: hypothetical protein H5T68_03845 [Chloroflexi bacterium]|nr:hypothetical protein [Chloroflexota bacterium]
MSATKRVFKKVSTPFEALEPTGAILMVNMVDPQISTMHPIHASRARADEEDGDQVGEKRGRGAEELEARERRSWRLGSGGAGG